MGAAERTIYLGEKPVGPIPCGAQNGDAPGVIVTPAAAVNQAASPISPLRALISLVSDPTAVALVQRGLAEMHLPCEAHTGEPMPECLSAAVIWRFLRMAGMLQLPWTPLPDHLAILLQMGGFRAVPANQAPQPGDLWAVIDAGRVTGLGIVAKAPALGGQAFRSMEPAALDTAHTGEHALGRGVRRELREVDFWLRMPGT